MKKVLIFSLLLFPFLINAQEEIAVKESIQRFFEEIQKGGNADTTLIRSLFMADAVLESINEVAIANRSINKNTLDELIGNVAKIPNSVKIEERILSWDIRVDGHLATAWTDYIFYVNNEISHCGVNAFQLFHTQDGWKIIRIIDTRYPSGCQNKAQDETVIINTFLDNWHLAAAKADEDTFFGSMTEDGIYIGTDKTERWLRDDLRGWAVKAFERESAWDFKPFDRHVYLSEDGKMAWWEEKLETWMGVCMGSGVLVKTPEGWKIKHFHLGVTIDNDKMKAFMEIGKK